MTQQSFSQDNLRRGFERTQFKELQTSEKDVRVYATSQYGLQYWQEQFTDLSSSGINVTNPGGITKIDSGTTAADELFVESNNVLDYRAGKEYEVEIFIKITALPTQNQVFRWGLGTEEDGVFYVVNSSGIRLMVRKNGNERFLSNLSSDGSSNAPVTGFNMDLIPHASHLKRGNIWGIRGSFYGGGLVKWFLDHAFANGKQGAKLFEIYDPRNDSTLTDGQYMRTANLPVRYELDNDSQDSGTPPDSNFEVFVGERQASIYGSERVSSEQHLAEIGAYSPIADFTPYAAIRKKDQFHGMPNRANVYVDGITAIANSADSEIIFRVGDTVDSTAWSEPQDYSGDESAFEIVENADIDSFSKDGKRIQPYTVSRTSEKLASGDRGISTSLKDLGIGREQVVTIMARGSDLKKSFIKVREDF